MKKNDVFVRFPNETIAYYDYPSDPFNYIFVTFHGSVVKNYLARVGITPKNRVVQTTAELTSLFKNMISSCRDYSAISDMISSGLLQLIFAELAKNHVPTVKEDYRPKNNYVNNVLEFIDANLSNPDLTADYAAQFLNLNTDYFLRIFKDVTGIPFSKFIEAKKMNLAASLLLEGKISVSRISEECGYSSPSYFTKVFRANFPIKALAISWRTEFRNSFPLSAQKRRFRRINHIFEGYFVCEKDPAAFERFDEQFPKKEKLRLPGQLF